MNRPLALLLAFALALVAGPAAAAPVAAPAPALAEWTLLYFIAADNDLARAALADVNELEGTPAVPGVDVLVALDISAASYTDNVNEWDGMKIVRIRPDGDPVKITSPVVKDLGAVNTGDPRVLASFIETGAALCPAKRTALVIWNHGTGWKTIPYGDAADGISGRIFKAVVPQGFDESLARCIAYDDVSRDSLTLKELGDTLAAASRKSLRRPFDLLVFDACMMQMAEVADAVAPSARYMLASEEVTPDAGYDHADLLARLAAAPTADAGAVGKSFAESFIAGYKPPNRVLPATISLLDLSKLVAFKTRLAAFARAVGRPEGAATLKAALADVKKFYFADYIDLDHFALRCGKFFEGAEVAEAVAALRASLRDLVVANVMNHGKFGNCGGLSIYFPAGKIDPAYAKLPFAAASGWLDLLRLTLESREGARIEVADAWIDDEGGDGLVAAGEPAKAVFTLENIGRDALTGAEFLLRSDNPRLALETSSVRGASIAAGKRLNLLFKVASSASPTAHETASLDLSLKRDGVTSLIGRYSARLGPAFAKTGAFLLVNDRKDAAVEMLEAACREAGLPLDVWTTAQLGDVNRRLLETYRAGVVIRLLPESGGQYAFTPVEDRLFVDHLKKSGRLLLSGQDFATTYGGGKLFAALSVTAAADDSGSKLGAFTDGGPGFDLSDGDSAGNQLFPDALAAGKEGTVVARYLNADGTPGAAAAVLKKSGGSRALVLGFGIEGVSGAKSRADVLKRCLALLEVDVKESVAKIAETKGEFGERSLLQNRVAADLARGDAASSFAFLEEVAKADADTRQTFAGTVKTIREWALARQVESCGGSVPGAPPDPATPSRDEPVTRLLEAIDQLNLE